MAERSTGSRSSLVLVTGATGYIGGRLVPRLIEAGQRVRCLVRDPARVDPEIAEQCEVVQGSVDANANLSEALAGVSQAYYLIHAMRDNDEDFASRDREQAERFGAACAEAGVERIIYLGGLGDPNSALSPHLRSRHEVGEALAVGVRSPRSEVVVPFASVF